RAAARAATPPVTLHAHGLRAGALAALALIGRRRARLVVTLHNRTVGSRATRNVGALLLRFLAARADAVLAVSPDPAELARHAVAPPLRHPVAGRRRRAGARELGGGPRRARDRARGRLRRRARAAGPARPRAPRDPRDRPPRPAEGAARPARRRRRAAEAGSG